MRLQKSNSFIGVSSYFILDDNDLIYLSLSKEINRIGNINWKFAFKGICYPKYINKEDLFVQYRRENEIKDLTKHISILTGKEELEIIPKHYQFICADYFGNLVFRSKNEDRTSSIHYLDKNKYTLIWSAPLDFKAIEGVENGLIINNKNSNNITLIKLETGSSKWQFDISKLETWNDYDGRLRKTEVSRILGIYNTDLFIYLNSGRILVLDLETGAKRTIIANDKNIDQGAFNSAFMSSIELDVKTGRLKQLIKQRYTEVNLSTFEVFQVHIEDMVSSKIENMSKFVFDNNHIYFIDRNHSKIGILSRNELKLISNYKLNIDDKVKPKEIKLFNNNIYVLDDQNVLHILKMEE
jgi:hypothetical protein